MSKYYGTAIKQPTGTGRPPQLPEVKLPPRAVIEWCEESGVPQGICLGCQEAKK